MTVTLLIDGVKYKLWTPQKEAELEEKVKEHAKDIFGEDSIYFEKRKISSELGIRSIPDGFAIDFHSKKMFAIEIELSTHGYDHIVSQGNRHIDALNNLNTKHKLVKVFNNEIRSDPYKKLFAEKFVKDDLHNILTSISENPGLVIITDRISDDIKQAHEALNARIKTKIVEFKTFEREDVGLGVHAHLFEPMVKREIREGEEPSGKMMIAEDIFEVRTAREILINAGNWLIKQGKLKPTDCPIETGPKRNLVNREPKHRDGSKFRAPKKLSSGLWIETHYSRADSVKYAKRLLEKFNYSGETLKVVQ